jgi:hypothetical protein
MKKDTGFELLESLVTFVAVYRLPVEEPYDQRIGAMKEKLVLSEDFDAPLPDDILELFEGIQG